MANKKTPASSKTAHVMNLLSKSAPPADEASATPEEPQAAAPAAPAAAPSKPPIIVSLSSDAEVSEQIRDALENALEADGAEPPAAQAPAEVVAEETPEETAVEDAVAEEVPEETAVVETVAEEAPEETTAKETVAEEAPEETAAKETVAEEAPEETAVVETVAEEAPEQPTAPAMDEPAPAAEMIDIPGSSITCVNVMQVLVDENADKYVKMFGLCQCPHCMADVKALALNNLQPKYVVMEHGHVVPRISVYEGRYQAAVTAQILRACTTVMEQPRHEKPI